MALAGIFGRVEDEGVGRVDESGDHIWEPAGAVGDVARALEDRDGQVGCVAARLHRPREPGRAAAAAGQPATPPTMTSPSLSKCAAESFMFDGKARAA